MDILSPINKLNIAVGTIFRSMELMCYNICITYSELNLFYFITRMSKAHKLRWLFFYPVQIIGHAFKTSSIFDQISSTSPYHAACSLPADCFLCRHYSIPTTFLENYREPKLQQCIGKRSNNKLGEIRRTQYDICALAIYIRIF